MSAEQNKAVVRRLILDGYGRRDPSVLKQVFAQDVCDHNPAPGQPRGLEGQRWFFDVVSRAVPDGAVKLEQVVAEGDFVADHWITTGTQTGELMGIPATGKRFTMSGSELYRISDGKIAEFWHLEDMVSMLQQLGAIPAQGSQGAPPSSRRPSASSMSQPTRGKSLSDGEKRDLIRRGYRDFIDRHDFSLVDTLIAPNYVGHFSAAPEIHGRDDFRQYVRTFTDALSNQHADVEDIAIDGDYAACRLMFTGRHTGNLFGAAPTGREVKNTGLSIFHFAGDQIVEQWGNNDDMSLLQQIGAIPVAQGMPVPEPC